MSNFFERKAIAALFLLWAAAAVCRADEITWTGATSINWFTGGNWSSNTVPGQADLVTIAATANQPVVSGATARIEDLALDASTSLGINAAGTVNVIGDSIINAGTINANGGALNLTMNSGGSNSGGAINVLNGGQFNIQGDFANLTGGVLNIDNGSNLSARSNFTNGGGGSSVNVSGTATIQGDFATNDGLKRVNAGGTMTMTTGTMTNTGTVSAQGSTLVARFGTLDLNMREALSNSGGTLNAFNGGVLAINAGDLSNLNGGSINVSNGGNLTAGIGNLDNTSGASINVSGTANLVLDNLTNESLVQSKAGGHLTLTADTLTNDGTLQADDGTLDLKFGLGLDNSGTISALNGGLVNLQGNFDNTGNVRLGAGSEMTVSGTLTDEPGATTEFDLLTNSQFGGILIDGGGPNNVNLGGALVIALAQGSSLSNGVLTILNDPNGTISGNFAGGLSGSLGSGITYLESISADRHSVLLTLDASGPTSTVPEPPAWELTAIGIAGLAWRIRKGRLGW